MVFSLSTSSVHKSFKYDVFLSFTSEDIPKIFVDRLYDAFDQQGIRVFTDDGITNTGKLISDVPSTSVEDSKFFIIILSKNYASSFWCLKVLAKMMRCHKTLKQTAFPLFYHVEPSEVRNGTVLHDLKHNVVEVTLRRWRNALEEAADLAGWELTVDRDQADFIKQIVEYISLELRPINDYVDKRIIGMDARILRILPSLEIGFEDVRIIGIKGMRGSGKTTLARAVFDQISSQFEGKSFVENISEIAKAPLSGLQWLENQVSSDILKENISLKTYEGKNLMNYMKAIGKVLVVLDDVDDIHQINAIVAEPNLFKSGSRIIITTRDEQVLKSLGVTRVHNVDLLSDADAIFLLSRYAFGKDIPTQGYEELSRRAVYHAAGLPLLIRVLGSFLHGRNKLDWMDQLERLQEKPFIEPLNILELSYESLDDDLKEIFLDIACFMKGSKKDDTVRVLESCGFDAKIGLKVLEQKCLITISGDHILGMHDLIQETGRYIVRRSDPDQPKRHSRLWIHSEIEGVLADRLGTEATKAIAVYTPVKLDFEIVTKGFGSMRRLRLLRMISEIEDYSDVKINEVSESFSDALRFLSWVGYPHWCLPIIFQANNLVALEMPYSRIVRLWGGGERKVLSKLKFLNLSHSKLRTLELWLMPNLEVLKLKECHDLEELHAPFASVKLKSVNLSHLKLRNLDLSLMPNVEVLKLKEINFLKEPVPLEFVKLRSVNLSHLKLNFLSFQMSRHLETLHIEECHDLEVLHIPSSSVNLRYVYLRHLKLKCFGLSSSLSLKTLHIEECHNLKDLRLPFISVKLRSVYLSHLNLKSLSFQRSPGLKTLHVEKCHDLEEIHVPFQFVKLRSFYLSQLKLKFFPFRRIPNLETLHIEECHDLLEPDHMQFKKLRSLKLSHIKWMTLDLRQTYYLGRLDLQDCNHLVDICMLIGGLRRLVFLNLSGCSSIKSFLFIKELKALRVLCLARLNMREFPDIIPEHSNSDLLELRFRHNDIDQLPSSIENFQKLVYLDLHSCRKLTRLPGSICGLRHLRNLKLYGCVLEKLPEDIDKLESLEKLNLSFTCIKLLPESICELKHLKTLNLSSCWNLEKLPEDLGRMGCLQNLILTECTRVTRIPDSICTSNCLKYLSVMGCIQLEKLPEELGLVKSLEELNLKDTLIRHLPRSISLLNDLKIYGPKSGLRYRGYASTSGTLEASSSKKTKG